MYHLFLNICYSNYLGKQVFQTDKNSENRGEFNNASARRALVDWYLSLFIMCKAGHQYNERPRALALLNLPQLLSNTDRTNPKVKTNKLTKFYYIFCQNI